MSSDPDKKKLHEKRHYSWCDTRMTLNVTRCSCVILQDHLGRSCRLVFFTSCFLPRASPSEQQLPPCSEYLSFLFKEEHGGRDLMKCLPGQRPRGKVTHNTSFLPYQRGMDGQIQFRDSPKWWCFQSSKLFSQFLTSALTLNWLDDILSRYHIHLWMAALCDYPGELWEG